MIIQFFAVIVAGIVLFRKMLFQKAKNLENQVVLITGGAKGLGKEIAMQLAKYNCKIAIADLDMANAEKTCDELRTQGTLDVKAYKVDVSSLAEIEHLKTQITKDLGPVDIVINNAAIIMIRSVQEENPELLQKMIDVNVMSLVWTTRVFLQDLIDKKRGHIVSISSIGGLFGAPDLHVYSTSKFAVRGFMEALYTDLLRYDNDKFVKTTTVFPCFINTEHTNNNYKLIKMWDVKSVAKRIVKAIRYDERIVTIPSIAYIFGYKIQIPTFIWRAFIKNMTKPKKN
ncbi:short-chain dehydrogenase/reductase family 16C member 6-like isoform X2 [Culicoides brevitarsis]|uniref:short-chain dehydrogenase/reductase family 16C member 6-like isoform X2 n=1 Tax=Culicoides brevitarsis TaxID=469753 RepID=UPI00307C594C